jgi:RNA polymerase sigma factor (sigma-70 family)
MATGQTGEVLRQLRRAVLPPDGGPLTDGQLLESFLDGRDEAALAALVRRHGPMVWGVCRRVLTNHHDAEDAFQATFLVLVRKAASVRPRALVGNWLYGVARQTALKARALAARRKGRERQVTEMPEAAVADQDRGDDLLKLLDEELGRLPDKYRAVLVLCDLEGKTRREVAGQLDLAEGTVASRLARGRAMLGRRLTRRGVALPAGALAAVLARQVSAGVPAPVLSATIKAVTVVAVGKAATGVIAAPAAALAEGVLKAMLMCKLKAALAVVLALGLLATGAAVLACRPAPPGDRPPAAGGRVQTPQRKRRKEDRTAWGMQVGGLQAGLAFRPAGRRVYHYGETITLVVRVRNVGKKAVKLQYLEQYLDENPPTVTDADGKAAPQNRIAVLGFHVPVEVTLEPGKAITLKSHIYGGAGLRYVLRPPSDRAKGSTGRLVPLYVGIGKVGLQYERVFGNTSAGRIQLDPNLSRLATGKLELEVTGAANGKEGR